MQGERDEPQKVASAHRTGKLPPEIQKQKPKGELSWWARGRRLIWSWWLWVLSALPASAAKRWVLVSILIVVALLFYLATPTEEPPVYGLDHDFSIESEEFLRTIVGATGVPFTEGNQITFYNNGDAFYPEMLAAINQAEQSITMEAYIYWEGQIGQQFAEALAAKAQAGVSVKLLLDAVGSSTIGDRVRQTLIDGGCQLAWYHPLHWYSISRINNRTHRKSLIIDGKVGFTGGAGIADHWLGNAQDAGHWRDIQIKIKGPAVVALQTGFTQNWLETTGELVTGPKYYPPIEPVGNLAAQSILSSPESGSSTVRLLYYLSIVSARKSIYIANPYFVPDHVAVSILTEAKRRGVDVKILTAGVHNDNKLARLNSVRLYGQLLEAGVEIYEYNRTMLHHKIMIVDGRWATVGTTNFDNRSLGLNDEHNVSIYDRAFAGALQETFLADLAVSDRVVLEHWRNRGLGLKIQEYIASFLKEQV